MRKLIPTSRWSCAASLLLVGAVVAPGCTTDFGAGEPDAAPFCGNGAIEPPEACDGENLAEQTCVSEGFGGGTLRCTDDCQLVLTGCHSGCGNGMVEPGEECDDAAANADDTPDACRTDCLAAHCGDGVADASELCDGADLRGEACEGLGLGAGELGCAPDCGSFDVSGCETPTLCGNEVIDPGEVCDGSTLAGADCVSLGYEGGVLGCAPDCLALDEGACLRADGAPCDQSSQCDGGLCLDEVVEGYPQGQCTRTCGGGIDCGDLVCAQTLSGFRYCAVGCAQTSECRPGYACFSPVLSSAEHCAPHCEVDADCPTTQACNPWSGLCGDPVVGAENGAPCLAGDPCRGSFCSFDYDDGYCVSFCSLSTGLCPGDNECSDVFNGIAGDMGLCFDGCLVQSDCQRPGYSCEPNPYGSGTVCISP